MVIYVQVLVQITNDCFMLITAEISFVKTHNVHDLMSVHFTSCSCAKIWEGCCMIDYLLDNKFRVIITVLVIAAAVVFFVTRSADLNLNIARDGEQIVAPIVFQEGSYAEFLHNHSRTPRGTVAVEVDIFNVIAGQNYSILTNFQGVSRVLRTEENSYVTFTVNIPTAGLYSLNIEYFPVAARGIDMARALRINGEIPFSSAEMMTFSRVWGDGGPVRADNRGNQIRPPQVELPRWERSYFSNRLGFFTDPYQFFFEAGVNTITLVGISEPMVIAGLTVIPVRDLPTFAEFMATNTLPYGQRDFYARIQGQYSTVRSSPSLFPIFDNSSGVTNPPSVATVVLNMIGGFPWRIPGQWIEWEVEVPTAGLYRISVSARQNYNRGFVSSRTIMVNGEIPFEEVAFVPFHFNNSWQLTTFHDDNGEYLLFPLDAGVNTIRMEVTLGELGEIVERIMASVYRLNAIYRDILVLTGPNPDVLRDYRIQYWFPHVMEGIYQEIYILYEILNDLTEFSGERNQHTGMIATMVRQLDLFYSRPDRIPVQLTNWRQNISGMGDTARQLMEGHLDIDFLVVTGVDTELPVVRETFFNRLSHEVRAFIASFTHDFDTIGDVAEGDRVIEVWLPTGRDQAQVVKSMIDDSFTPDTGIGVNLRLVAHAAILPAVVAGIGPDLALSLPLPDPINYALRNAVVDLTQFDNFSEVAQRFAPSAMVPFELEGAYFALPETQNFSVMFYRTDILNSLDLLPPETWDDVLAMMPILQRNNMSIGIPPVGNPMAPDLSGFLTQLYQRGGFIYNDEHSRAILDSEEAIAAFEAFTRFFTHFGSPTQFDFNNRFRSGEMPIGFVDFTTFNTLSVFAPEIAGLWNFGLMPGYMHSDGTIDHTVPAWGSAAVMFAAAEAQDDAWQFLDWWTSAPTQLRFGRELEAVMGAAARFPTANLDAFQSLPWSTHELAILNEQREWTLGTPEVPGGYYVGRHLVNAMRRVINSNVDTRETLLDFNIVINQELINKRREFGLE